MKQGTWGVIVFVGVFTCTVLAEGKAPTRTVYFPEVVSLGRLLPDMTAMGVDLRSDQLQNRRLLICFWDMQQRPSRNCVLQLAQQTRELERNDVTVVAIQVADMDENTLAHWVQENHVSYPVGMIKADEKKTRLNWGVKSQPWLILTDKEHIVRAEGFGIEELETLIK